MGTLLASNGYPAGYMALHVPGYLAGYMALHVPGYLAPLGTCTWATCTCPWDLPGYTGKIKTKG